MAEEGGDGHGDQSWELAKLVGNYERFTKDVDQKLTRIEDRLNESAETFGNIKTTMATRTEQINNLGNRVEDIEDNGGLSRRRRWQVDGTTLAAVILTVKEIFITLMGGR